MPMTLPFHAAPVALQKALFPNSTNATAALACQFAIDAPVVARAVFGLDGPLHGPEHTLIGMLLICFAVCLAVGLWQRDSLSTIANTAIGAALGHWILDVYSHAEMSAGWIEPIAADMIFAQWLALWVGFAALAIFAVRPVFKPERTIVVNWVKKGGGNASALGE